MQFEFRKITGYDNYSVSNTGLVRNDITNKTLQPCITNGYHIVSLSLNGKGKKFRVHRLVADAFIDNPDNKPCVDHIDNNRANNHITNLRWATVQENNRNMKIGGRNTTGVKGVRWCENKNKWRAEYSLNNKTMHIGYYKTLEVAAEARRQVVKKVYGDFINNCEKAPVININIIENAVINN